MIPDYLAALWRYKVTLLLAALASGAAGAVVAGTRPPVYRATSTVQVVDNLTVPETFALLQDQTAVQKVLDALPAGTAPSDASAFVADHLELQAVPGSALIRLHVLLPDREAAARAAHLLAEEASARDRARQAGALDRRQATLARRRDDTAARLEGLRAELAAEARGASQTAGTGPAVPRRLSRLELDYTAAERVYAAYAEQALQAELTTLEAAPRIEVVGVLPPLQTRAGVLQMALAAAVIGLMAAALAVCTAAYVRSTRLNRREPIVPV